MVVESVDAETSDADVVTAVLSVGSVGSANVIAIDKAKMKAEQQNSFAMTAEFEQYQSYSDTKLYSVYSPSL